VKVTLKGIIHELDWDIPNDPKEYRLFGTDMTDKYYTAICPVEVEVEIPDNFDPRPAKIAAIDAQIASVRAEMTARVTELMEQRSRYLAIENTVEAA
jgi:hypothetical protein